MVSGLVQIVNTAHRGSTLFLVGSKYTSLRCKGTINLPAWLDELVPPLQKNYIPAVMPVRVFMNLVQCG